MVNLKNSLDLRKQSTQKAEVPASHPDDRCDSLSIQFGCVGQCYSPRPPAARQQFSHLICAQCAKFMYETNTRIELWVACQALFDSRHSDQHQSDASGIKDRAHLLKACHSQAISFIYQNEPGRVTNGALLVRVP